LRKEKKKKKKKRKKKKRTKLAEYTILKKHMKGRTLNKKKDRLKFKKGGLTPSAGTGATSTAKIDRKETLGTVLLLRPVPNSGKPPG